MRRTFPLPSISLSIRTHPQASTEQNGQGVLRPNPSSSLAIKPDAPQNTRMPFDPRAIFHAFLEKVPPPPGRADTPEIIESLKKKGVELRNRLSALEPLKGTRAWTADQEAKYYFMDFQRKWIFCRCLRINQLVSVADDRRPELLLIFYLQPTEILLQIFHLVSWSSTDMPSSSLSLLRLTWICQKWRYAAIEDMTLWSIIWFKDPYPYERSFAFLERAGTAPLDIRINERHEVWYKEHMNDLDDSEEDGHPFKAEMMENLMDKLLLKVQTIRTLVIMVDTWKPALAVLQKLRDCYYKPMRIERFELHRTGRPWLWVGPMHESQNRPRPIAFCGRRILPRLTYACFNGLHIRWSVLQLSRLHVLDLRRVPLEKCPSLYDFRDMLEGCPRLSKLALDAAGPKWILENEVVSGLPPIDLPCLATLVLGDFTVLYAIYVLNTFTAKNLIDLTVLNMVGFDYGPLIEHLVGRFPEVRVLTMYSLHLLDSIPNKRHMIKWLQSMPKIEILKIARLKKTLLQHFLEDANVWAETKDLLAPKKPFIPLLPKLQILEYQAMPFDCVSHLVEGRKNIGAPLKRVYVIVPWFAQMDVTEKNWLAKMAQLFQLNPGMPNPEELELRRVWTKETGIPLPYLY